MAATPKPMRKSPKAARDANPQNAERKKMRHEAYHKKEVLVGKKPEEDFKNPPKLIKSSQAEVDKINKYLRKHDKKTAKTSQKHSKEDLSKAADHMKKHSG